jgi:hypothetical protein
MGDQERLPRGFLKDILQLPPQVAFVGHVEGIVLTTFVGCYAVVVLSDSPGKEIGVVTSEQRLQSLLETALATGNLVMGIKSSMFRGLKTPPCRTISTVSTS